MSKVFLSANSVRFFSPKDEECFFSWLEQIGDVERVCGVGTQIQIELKQNALQDESLRELIALFYRFNISAKQLAQFRTQQNESWFFRETAYWYDAIFRGPS